MGSSILASLSEAGGNDPCHPANGPLPPHSPDDADRLGTQPTASPIALRCPSAQPIPLSSPTDSQPLNVTRLAAPRLENSNRETPSRIGICARRSSIPARPSLFPTVKPCAVVPRPLLPHNGAWS